MAKKVEVMQVLENLNKAQDKLAKKWADAILKSNLDAGENFRNHMFALIGYREDIETILEQVDEYITKNKRLIGITKKKTKKVKSSAKTKSSKSYFRTRPLPPVGTKLNGNYKGKKFTAIITDEGIKINGFQKLFSSMSSATAAVTGKKTISGWAFWKMKK